MHKFEIFIKTDQYVGNFERELCAYVFGYSSDFAQDWVLKMSESFKSDEQATNLVDITCIKYDSHGETICKIEKSDNLIVFFSGSPEKYMPAIIRRLMDFPKVLAESWEYAPKNVKIIEVSLYQVKEERQEVALFAL